MQMPGSAPDLRLNKPEQVAARLRHSIRTGRYRPGQQLPSRQDLEKSLGVSLVTVQSALEQLARERVVYTRGRRGTFISEDPRSMNRVAIALLDDHAQSPLYLGKLVAQAHRLAQRQPITFEVYNYLASADRDAERERLLRDAHQHRLAGVIFAEHLVHPFGYLADQLPASIPRVVLTSGTEPGMPAVWVDHAQMLSLMWEQVKQCRRQRVAVLTTLGEFGRRDPNVMIDLMRRAGLKPVEPWIIPISPAEPHTVTAIVRLLLHGSPKDRPDAIVLTDQYLEAPALTGLMMEGVAPGRDLDLITQANFPITGHQPAAVRRVGFNLQTVLERALDILTDPPATDSTLSLIPAVPEAEVVEPTQPGLATSFATV